MSQILIALFGLAGAYMALVSRRESHRRWAPVVGLCGQPFWLYVTGSARQWGMFCLCCAYTAIYLVAIWRTYQRVQCPSRQEGGAA